MDSNDFLRTKQDGIEFFTVKANGLSAVSVRGLARMCGVSHTAIEKLLIALGNQTAPKMLETLYGQELYLATKIFRRGKEIAPIRSQVASLIIRYYDLQGKEAAAQSLNAFMAIGLESYIQGQTGFLPEAYAESTLEPRYRITRLVREPNPWKRLYTPEMCDKIRTWYFPKTFFWQFAYAWMSKEEIAFLNEHNPVIEGICQRKERIFQFLSQDTLDRLAPEIDKLCWMVESSTGKQDFQTRWDRLHGKDQQELTF
jgi:hypothetical protein